MKRNRPVIFLLILLLIFTLGACSVDMNKEGSTGTGGNESEVSADNLQGYQISTSGVKSFGIIKKAGEGAKTTGKNYFVSYDSQNKVSDVVFSRTISNKKQDISQDELTGQVIKLFVASEFTYICFNITENAESDQYYNDNYNSTNYYCSTVYHSYAIHNATGKVYSLEDLGLVSKVGPCYLVRENKYYRTTIQDGNLVVTPYVTNPNIYVWEVFEDKFGTVFVHNDTAVETVGNTVYYIGDGFASEKGCYLLGDDGYMYVLSSTGSLDISVRRYNTERRLEPVGGDLTVSLRNSEGLRSYFLHNGMLYECSEVRITSYYYNGSLFRWGDCSISGLSATASVGDYLFAIKQADNAVVRYQAESDGTDYLDRPAFKMKETAVGLAANKLVPMGDYLLAVAEGAQGTKRYKVTMNGDTPSVSLLDETTYGGVVITVQPLTKKA